MVPGSAEDILELHFAQIRIDGHLRRPFDALLRIVAVFWITLNGEEVYREVEYPVVELCAQLSRWLIHGMREAREFVYTSEESDMAGLVTFRQEDPGRWRVSVYDLQSEQRRTLSPLVGSDAIRSAIRSYAVRLFDELPDRVRVLRLLDDEGERDLLTLFREVDNLRNTAS